MTSLVAASRRRATSLLFPFLKALLKVTTPSFGSQFPRGTGVAGQQPVGQVAIDHGVGPLVDEAEAGAAAHEHLDDVALGEIDGGLAAQLLDGAVGAEDAAIAALARFAAQQAFGRQPEAVRVDRELHIVLQDLAAPRESRAAAPRAEAKRIGCQLVTDDAEEVVVDVERFDGRVRAVAERRVDRIAAVGAPRG